MCFDEESILHIACGVIFSKIQCGEHVPVILNFRTLGNTETQTCKYIDDFVFYDGERVACTQFYRISGTSEVNIVTTRILAFELFFQGVNLFLRLVFSSFSLMPTSFFCSAATLRKSAIKSLIAPFY